MMKKLKLCSLIMMAAGLSFAVQASSPDEAKNATKRPNVLFVMCDDLANRVGVNGYSHVQTPNIDKFARSALNFHRAVVQYPMCGPSRASMLTGLYCEKVGQDTGEAQMFQYSPGVRIMPQIFRDNGYWTGGLGKISHNPWQDPELEGSWDEFHLFRLKEERKKSGPSKYSMRCPVQNDKKWSERIIYQSHPADDKYYPDAQSAEQAISWMKERKEDGQPFFIACGFLKPHNPYTCPEKYYDMYADSSAAVVHEEVSDWDNRPIHAKNSFFNTYGFKWKENDPERAAGIVRAYHACITYVDAQFGKIMDALDEQGLSDNTIVVFTSDHGYHLGEHFLWAKFSLFDESLRVPTFIRVPGANGNGKTTKSPVGLIDLLPTLQDYCGLDIAHKMQGKSLRPIVDDPSHSVKEYEYSIWGKREPELKGRSLLGERYHFIQWLDNENEVELYDLEKDPGEHVNLARHPEYGAMVKNFLKMVQEKKRSILDL
ncbi:sulfatase [Pontiella desulfatans]|nr:sulfatase [Pontiella desulfatans]